MKISSQNSFSLKPTLKKFILTMLLTAFSILITFIYMASCVGYDFILGSTGSDSFFCNTGGGIVLTPFLFLTIISTTIVMFLYGYLQMLSVTLGSIFLNIFIPIIVILLFFEFYIVVSVIELFVKKKGVQG